MSENGQAIVVVFLLALLGLMFAFRLLQAAEEGLRRGRARRLKRDFRNHRCSHCGYDIRVKTNRCPECGTFCPRTADLLNMLELLEAIFIILTPLLFIAAIVNRVMMRVHLRRLKRLLAADGRCTRCALPLDASGKCTACDKAA